jgi:hypothetical protein
MYLVKTFPLLDTHQARTADGVSISQVRFAFRNVRPHDCRIVMSIYRNDDWGKEKNSHPRGSQPKSTRRHREKPQFHPLMPNNYHAQRHSGLRKKLAWTTAPCCGKFGVDGSTRK